MGNKGWSYDDVLQYFIKSEDDLQIDRVDQGCQWVSSTINMKSRRVFIEGDRRMGQTIRDLNGVVQDGFAFAQATSKHGIRFSTSHAFLHPELTRKNLHMMLQTFVTRVIIDSETKKAIGI